MKEGKGVTKIKIKRNMYIKIIACFVLVNMFTGYLIPLYEINKVYAKSKYSGGSGSITMQSNSAQEDMDEFLNQFHWNDFLKENSDTDFDGMGIYKSNSYTSFYFPDTFIDWCIEKGYTSYRYPQGDNVVFYDFDSFEAVKQIFINGVNEISWSDLEKCYKPDNIEGKVKYKNIVVNIFNSSVKADKRDDVVKSDGWKYFNSKLGGDFNFIFANGDKNLSITELKEYGELNIKYDYYNAGEKIDGIGSTLERGKDGDFYIIKKEKKTRTSVDENTMEEKNIEYIPYEVIIENRDTNVKRVIDMSDKNEVSIQFEKGQSLRATVNCRKQNYTGKILVKHIYDPNGEHKTILTEEFSGDDGSIRKIKPKTQINKNDNMYVPWSSNSVHLVNDDYTIQGNELDVQFLGGKTQKVHIYYTKNENYIVDTRNQGKRNYTIRIDCYYNGNVIKKGLLEIHGKVGDDFSIPKKKFERVTIEHIGYLFKQKLSDSFIINKAGDIEGVFPNLPDGHQNANYMTIRLEYDKITSPNTGENNNNSGNNGNKQV